MTSRFDIEMLAAGSRLEPESDGLSENADEWCVGTISVPKLSAGAFGPGVMPTYRRGWQFRLADDMDFVARPFTDFEGAPAFAVLLRGAEGEFFAGWFRETRREEVLGIVTQLNHELDAVRDACRAEDSVTMVVGSDFAPDSPFGSERVTVWPDGRAAYLQRNRGITVRRADRLQSTAWPRVLDGLRRSGFPAQPDLDVSPGGSAAIILGTGTARGRIHIDLHDALRVPGYEDAVSVLWDALRSLRPGAEIGAREDVASGAPPA